MLNTFTTGVQPLQSISIAEERHVEAARATPPYGALPQYGSSRRALLLNFLQSQVTPK